MSQIEKEKEDEGKGGVKEKPSKCHCNLLSPSIVHSVIQILRSPHRI